MADFRSRQRVQIHDGTDEFGVLSTKPIFVNVGNGTNQLSIDGSGFLNVNVVSGGGGGAQFAEDSAHVSGNLGTQMLAVRSDTLAALAGTTGDYTPLQVDASGALYISITNASLPITDNGGSITIDNPTLSVVGGGVEATALRVTIANDSTGVLSIDDNGGSITVDGTVIVTQPTHDNLNLNANIQVADTDVSVANPVPVRIVGFVSSGEVNNYTTTAAVAKDATVNHDYTVTAAKTLLLRQIIISASGAIRGNLLANAVSKAMIFTSGSQLTQSIIFAQPIEVAATQVVRITIRNDDNSAMDVYSTLIGEEI